MARLVAMRGGWTVVRSALFAVAVLGPALAPAQIPDKFTNLQVLPKEIQKRELVDTMRGFTAALGVRCTHCHVGEEGQPLSTYDFAADTKLQKKTARLMIQMAGGINDQWIAKAETGRAERIQVSCATCHHGQPVPRSIQATVQATLDAQGLDAALQKYRDLRRDFYGRDSYDFGEPPLNQLGRQLTQAKKTAEAIAILGLNGEFHPQSGQIPALLGEAHWTAGHADEAQASFRKALEIDPGNEWAKKRLEEIGKPAAK